jgi:peptidoglycan/xylan/chitin deacetylase (PgdA/CDA1 family)
MFWRILTLTILLFTFSSTLLAEEQPQEPNPFVLYGNEPAFSNNIVLTIDDCSVEYNVRWVFDILRNRGLTATFFCNTENLVNQDPQLWRDILAAGNELAYHTRFHMSYLTPEQLDEDFAVFVQEIRTILNDPNYTIRYIRPPRGVWNEDWLNWGESRGLLTVRWNFTLPETDPEMAYNIILHRQRGGSILLTHTGRADTQWLEDNVDNMMGWHNENGDLLLMRSISNALND